MTREQWLQDSLQMMKTELFTDKVLGEHKFPQVHISVGFPSTGRGTAKRTTLGECWSEKVSGDRKSHIFLTPTMDDGNRVLDVVAHEMIHAILGTEEGHGKNFRKMALAIGLTGKMTATIASDELKEKLNAIIDLIGAYPHPTFSPSEGGKKKQSTRMLKTICEATEYAARLSNKWLEEYGAPICPCCQKTMTIVPPKTK